MGFVDDREDINSIALTAVQRLLENYQIDPRAIGRVEVGTESLVDKSKSTKTTLMQLFASSGNLNIEGATVMNACYGGTAALFNSSAWVESSEWDGRFAIYVACDIAVYEPGNARPTGGCGATAFLLGPNAPLRLVPKARYSHSVDVYDFYKPKMSSEYPAVDGALSQVCYTNAVDECYNGTLTKLARVGGGPSAQTAKSKHHEGPLTVESAFDYVLFHSPYNKLVSHSFRRMLWNDALRIKNALKQAGSGASLPALYVPIAKFLDLPYDKTIANKELEKTLASIGNELYAKMVEPSVGFSQQVGNCYTASVHSNLLGLIDNKQGNGLEGKRLGIFSYGSGAIATLFTLDGVASGVHSPFSLGRIANTVKLSERLAARKEASPEEFTESMKIREQAYGKSSYIPVGSLDNIAPGTFYLKEVTGNHARVYGRK
jgi:hydroxymethylglutaryl-CoA synthase